MKTYRNALSGAVLVISLLLTACQKDSDGGNNGNNTNQKPKVGTTWTYRYYTFYVNGGLATSSTIRYKAVSEVTLGGETWLKINEMGPDTTVYYLKGKTGGLYQYANNSSNLFCKDPASAGETYTTYHRGSSEDFTVVSVGQILPTDIGDVSSNFYEGKISGNLIDQVWYNSNSWILRHQFYRKFPQGTDYYKYSALFIESIVY